jgi:hypothetical protein
MPHLASPGRDILGQGIRQLGGQRYQHGEGDQQRQIARQRRFPGELPDAGEIADDFHRDGRAECHAHGHAGQRQSLRRGHRDDVPQQNSRAADAARPGRHHMRLGGGVRQHIPEILKDSRKHGQRHNRAHRSGVDKDQQRQGGRWHAQEQAARGRGQNAFQIRPG